MRNLRARGQTLFFCRLHPGSSGWPAELPHCVPPAAFPSGYDMALHAIALGFVLSIVFEHALIILPAILGIRLSYSPVVYLRLDMPHAWVLARIVG